MSDRPKELGCSCGCCAAVRVQLDALRDEVSGLAGLIISSSTGTDHGGD